MVNFLLLAGFASNRAFEGRVADALHLIAVSGALNSEHMSHQSLEKMEPRLNIRLRVKVRLLGLGS
jgi:hypothetical protein